MQLYTDAKQASRIVGGNPANGRAKADYYPTPRDCTVALIRYLRIPQGKTIWEPACGSGDMAEVFKEAGYSVHASDIRDTGYGQGGSDFLETPLPECDWIITNPPFFLAEKFIRRCHEHKKPFALLLKSQFWHGRRRIPLFCETTPSQILPLTWRPDFTGGGASMMDVIWCVWAEKFHPTTYKPLKRPEGTGIWL